MPVWREGRRAGQHSKGHLFKLRFHPYEMSITDRSLRQKALGLLRVWKGAKNYRISFEGDFLNAFKSVWHQLYNSVDHSTTTNCTLNG